MENLARFLGGTFRETEPTGTTNTRIAAITLPVVHAKFLGILHVCLDGLRGDYAIEEMSEFLQLYEDAVINLAEFVSEEDRDDH